MTNATVTNQRLLLDYNHIAADTINYLEFTFRFRTDDWRNMEKWAHFAKDGDVYDVPLTDDCIRPEDHLNLSDGQWSLYLHGNEFRDGEVIRRITTNVVKFNVVPTGFLTGKPFEDTPPSAVEQLSAKVTRLEEEGINIQQDILDGMRADIDAAAAENTAGIRAIRADYAHTADDIYRYFDPAEADWVIGGVSVTGILVASTTERVRTGFIRVKAGSVFSIAEGYEFQVVEYSLPLSSCFLRNRAFSSDSYTTNEDCYAIISVRALDGTVWTEDTKSVPADAMDLSRVLAGNRSEAFTDITAQLTDGIIATDLEAGETITFEVTEWGSFLHILRKCRKGDTFRLTGAASAKPRLWCFTDENGAVIANAPEYARAEAMILSSPADGWLIVNLDSLYPPYSLEAVEGVDKLTERLSQAENTLLTMGTETAELSENLRHLTEEITRQENVNISAGYTPGNITPEGKITSVSYRVRTVGFLAAPKSTIIYTDDKTVRFRVALYSAESDDAFLTDSPSAWFTVGEQYIVPDNCRIRLTISYTDDSAISDPAEIASHVFAVAPKNALVIADEAIEIAGDAAEKAEIIRKTVYVSIDTGDDSNDGGADTPFKTIGKAVDSGADLIYCTPGVYPEEITVSDRKTFRMMLDKRSLAYNQTMPETPKITLRITDEISFTYNSDSGLYETVYEAAADSSLYRVFVDKTLSPTVAIHDSLDGYHILIFAVSDTAEDCFRVIPVLTLDECLSTTNSFFYDGQTIYANMKNIEGLTFHIPLTSDSGLTIRNVGEVVLENVAVEMFKVRNFRFENCACMKLIHCDGFGTCRHTCFSSINSNIDYVKCRAGWAAADGFSCHDYGTVNLTDCEAFFNHDDGVSHHYGSNGCVNGGEYHHNAKGGISPSYGSCVDIHHVHSHHNLHGLFYPSNNTYPMRTVRAFGNLLTDNGTAITVWDAYTVVTAGNIISGNDQESSIRGDAGIVSH